MGVADMKDQHSEGVGRVGAAAWISYQAELADRLADLEEDDVLLIEAMAGAEPEQGSVPYVQFCAWGDGLLRGEVSSNHVLTAARRLHHGGRQALRDLGFDAPTHGPGDEADQGSLNYHVDVERSEADRVAVMAVRALRDVFGVAHPVFLTGDVVSRDLPAPVEEAAADRVDEATATYPYGGHEELEKLVDQALIPHFGQVPRHDDDGDIPVDAGSTVIFIRVHEAIPVVELFACLVTDIEDRGAARFEVSVLNRDVRFVRFRLVDDSIMAEVHIPAWPFAPEHLRSMLAVMTDVVQRVEPDLVARVTGQRLDDDPSAVSADSAEAGGSDEEDTEVSTADDDEPGTRSAMARASEILAQLNAEGSAAVPPALAASICGHDAGLLLDMIRVEEERRLEWSKTRDAEVAAGETDARYLDGCEREIGYSERTISLLRRALRVVVERQAARDGEQVAPSRPVARIRQKRPQRVPDPTIEEVDPQIWS
jgi:hypothetical protein